MIWFFASVVLVLLVGNPAFRRFAIYATVACAALVGLFLIIASSH